MSEQLYLKYLMDTVGADSSLSLLCSLLLEIPFTYDKHIVTDGNRADDGLYMRERFVSCTGIVPDICEEATVLEVLVGLAVRIDRDIMGEPEMADPGRWFNTMLSNLGLIDMTDDCYDEEEARSTVDIWLNREYDFDGTGSLFPLKRTSYDQRHISIWDQANEYLVENY